MLSKSLQGSGSVDAHVEAGVVVVSQEIGQGARPDPRAAIGQDIRPLPQAGADEALRPAVGLRSVRPRSAMAHPGSDQERRKIVAPIVAAVAGQDPFDPDPVLRKPALGLPQDDRAADRRLVGEERDIGQPGVIVDCQVQGLPASSAPPPRAATPSPAALAGSIVRASSRSRSAPVSGLAVSSPPASFAMAQ